MKVSSFRLCESDLKTIEDAASLLNDRTEVKRATKSQALRVLIRRGFAALRQDEVRQGG